MLSSNFIEVSKVINAATITASGTTSSLAIDLTQCSGTFTVVLNITGNGTLKVDAKYSHDGTNYYIPESQTALVSGLTKTSGGGSDGNVMFAFSGKAAPYLKLLVTETGGANTVTVTATIAKV